MCGNCIPITNVEIMIWQYWIGTDPKDVLPKKKTYNTNSITIKFEYNITEQNTNVYSI